MALVDPITRILPTLSFHLEQYSFNFYSIWKACHHFVESRHALFLATVLADKATLATTYVIIGMDFLLNIYHGSKIVYFIKKKKASPSDENSMFKITYRFVHNKYYSSKSKIFSNEKFLKYLIFLPTFYLIM